MSEFSDEYIKSILNNIALDHRVVNCQIERQKFETVAQNYFGVLIPVVLRGQISGNETKFNLVLKLAPTDERYRVSGAITLAFEREAFVYSALLTKFSELQKHFAKSSQFITPKCYFVRTNYCSEAIVMDNMCSLGYKPYTQFMFLDYEHTIVSLKSLAQFHALSFVLKSKHNKLFEDIKLKCPPVTIATNKRFIEILNDRLDKAINKFDETEYALLFQKLKDNCLEYIASTVNDVKNSVISHGDIWKENILFKYEESQPSHPTSACLIDYQAARISSPAYDVMYLLSSSCDGNLRRAHLQKFISCYYETFAEVLKEADLIPETVYSRQHLDDDLKTVSPACLIFVNTAMWLSSGLQQEGHVRSKKVLVTDAEKMEASENYKDIIRNIVSDFRSHGYLSL